MTRHLRGALLCALLLCARATAAPDSVKLLANASATGGSVPVSGDGYVFSVKGTFGGATVSLAASDAGGVMQPVSGCSFTATGQCSVNIGQGSTVQAQVSGGSPSGLYAWLQGYGGPISAGSQGGGAMTCTVVTGDQAYTVGSSQNCTMTPSGRVKVGLSSATNIGGAVTPATTLAADLVACRYLSSLPSWSDTWSGALRCDATGALAVSLASVPLASGASTSAKQDSLLAAFTDASSSGTIAANTANATHTVSFSNGAGTVGFAISGLTSSGAILTVEGTPDGSTWATAHSVSVSTGALFSTITADGNYRIPAAGRRGVRLRVTTTGTGTISVASNVSTATHEISIDPNNAAFQGEVAMTVGTTYAVGRSLKAVCTVTGNVSVTYADGSTGTWAISATGTSVFPVAVTAVNTSGTTATCTYANLK